MALPSEKTAKVTKKGARGKNGTIVLSKTMLSSILVVAATIVILILVKTLLCKTGTVSGGVC